MTAITIETSEWRTLGPDNCGELDGHFLETTPGDRKTVKWLEKSKLIGLRDLRRGLEVKTFAHVGKVRIGNLDVTIMPKIERGVLLGLLRYAYGFRKLRVFSDSAQHVDRHGFVDILISQLNAEASEVIRRGLLRAYVPFDERLSSPRGGIDMARIVRDAGAAAATLPCRHYQRVEDAILNRVLMAGLRLAASLTEVPELRLESRTLAAMMEARVKPIQRKLTVAMLDSADRQQSRLTASYGPALSIIRLLVRGHGIELKGAIVKLPGFLFDMNAFFQTLVSRFLRDNLTGHEIIDEHSLNGMLRYDPMFNPRHRQAPTPRPDYVVRRSGITRAILDAKYRDLWEKSLPSTMLYQLVAYAISQPMRPESSILYPTTDVKAKEARIDAREPISGKKIAQVCLRPILLPQLARLVMANSPEGRREREALAHRLAFGN